MTKKFGMSVYFDIPNASSRNLACHALWRDKGKSMMGLSLYYT